MKIWRIITLNAWYKADVGLEYHFTPVIPSSHHKVAVHAHLITGLNIDYAANQNYEGGCGFKIKWAHI